MEAPAKDMQVMEVKDIHIRIRMVKTHKFLYIVEILLRALAAVGTSASPFFIFSDGRYPDIPALIILVYANMIVFGYTCISLLVVTSLGIEAVNTKYYFFVFVHDLFMTMVLMSECAAASAIGYVVKYGNKSIGWMAICDQFSRFCTGATIYLILSFLCTILYVCLTIISANKSRVIQV